MAATVAQEVPPTDQTPKAEGAIAPAAAAPTSESTTTTTAPIAAPKAADSPQKTPFSHPSPNSTAPKADGLTADQITKYNSLLNAASTWTAIPSTSATNSPVEPITEQEQMWLTRECLLRYLRASKWSVPDAKTRLLATLTWRREYGLEKHTAEYTSVENETGKQWILGYDVEQRPCHYLSPSRQNTERSEKQIQHLVFMLERSIDLMGPGQETLALLINFAETRKGQGATVGQGRQVLTILQSHYPERLGKALLSNLPWYIWGFFKVITPFIDPLTRKKLIFNEDLRLHVPPEQLLKSHGGDLIFDYDHSVYWPALNGLAAARQDSQRERWVRGGKMVGEFEAFLKGAQEESFLGTLEKGVEDVTAGVGEVALGEGAVEKLVDSKVEPQGEVAAAVPVDPKSKVKGEEAVAAPVLEEKVPINEAGVEAVKVTA